jgi:threonine dehydratase
MPLGGKLYTLPMGSTQTFSNLDTLILVTLDEIRAAAARISDVIVHTPLVRARLEGLADREVYLKAESLQPIGSFKLRGAANKILQLTPDEVKRGVITYSSGNHAQGVAYAAREVGAKAVIVMPSNAPAIKKAATLALGAEVVNVGQTN